MRPGQVPVFLAELSALGVTVEADSAGGLWVRFPKTIASPASIARRVRAVKPELLAYFQDLNAEAKAEPGGKRLSPRRTGLPEWTGDPELYGPDALPRKHAPPPELPPEDRPHASPLRLCGGCQLWTPHAPGSEMGYCSAGWEAQGLRPYYPGAKAPETSRGSRCWAWGGKGWRKAVRA